MDSSRFAPAALSINATKPGIKVPKDLFGIFFEEINQAGEGGLYAEMVRNRGLSGYDGKHFPDGWKIVGGEDAGTVSVATSEPLNADHPYYFHVESDSSAKSGVANDGFWGIATSQGKPLKLNAWVRGNCPIYFSLKTPTGQVLASNEFTAPGKSWRHVIAFLNPSQTSDDASLQVVAASQGSFDLSLASLMPVTVWKDRSNGLRPDLAEKVASIKPGFVRFPGGCYVEGNNFNETFRWKNTIGPIQDRKGIQKSMWGYPVSDGMGYHEYLQWCEDMGAAPLFVVNVGMNHTQNTPLADMNTWVQNALDAIEYANGPVTSKWGKLRAANGHPDSFHLKYIEIGNENDYDWSFGGPKNYAVRYKLVYDAIKAKYPNIICIADGPGPFPKDLVDEHYYSSPSWFWNHDHQYDSYSRSGPKIYVGEYAVTQDCGTGNLQAALGEAAFMTGIERNSDVVRMASYAPLLINTQAAEHGYTWNPDAIRFNNHESYGIPSYWVQRMFANNVPDTTVPLVVPKMVSKLPPIQGGIGLATWKTHTEFKNVQVSINGEKPGSGPVTFKKLGGDWNESNPGDYEQTNLDEDRQAVLQGLSLNGAKSYKIDFDVRPINGSEGFIFMFERHDDGSALQWNVGGWGNTQDAFQSVGPGGSGVIGNPVNDHVEYGKWMHITIERSGDTVTGSINGEVKQTLKLTPSVDLAASAGIKREGHQRILILKIVNGSNSTREIPLNLVGLKLSRRGAEEVLTGPSMTAENSYADPLLISPKIKAVEIGKSLWIAPRSLTIIRVPIHS